MRVNIAVSFLILCGVSFVESSRILALFPLPSPSHHNLYSPLTKELAERGHDVTVVSPFEETSPPKNGTYRVILLDDFREWSRKLFNITASPFEYANERNPFVQVSNILTTMISMGEQTLAHPKFQALMNENFDLIILVQFVNDAHKALSNHFKASVIMLSTVGSNTFTSLGVGTPAPPSYIPDVYLSYSPEMTFTERITNSAVTLFKNLLFEFYINGKQQEIINKYIPNPPKLEEVQTNPSLILFNSHPSINQAVPYVPNMIDIGGYHIKPPKKLPNDLMEYLDGSKNGVIYFSMGSNLKSAHLPLDKRESFLKTFAKLKLNVLWKWEDDVLPGQPSNVKLSKWLPQNDILAHPNVKLFITHGGLLSTTETVYHGVPVLAIPIFGDQKINAKTIENNGFGLTLQFRDLTEDTLTLKINELLNNQKYRNNAKYRSEIFHDRLVKPMDEAIYWVEYVIRHGGAPHLKVAGINLPWYQYHLLDVIAFVALCSLVLIFINYLILKTIFRRIFTKTTTKKKKNE